jgi:hypothetical protein
VFKTKYFEEMALGKIHTWLLLGPFWLKVQFGLVFGVPGVLLELALARFNNRQELLLDGGISVGIIRRL